MERLLEVIEKSLNFTHTCLYEPCNVTAQMASDEEQFELSSFLITTSKDDSLRIDLIFFLFSEQIEFSLKYILIVLGKQCIMRSGTLSSIAMFA